MKIMHWLIIASLALATLALAEETSYTLTSSTQATAPSGASQTGASAAIANGWKGVGVAIYDVRDGGNYDNNLIFSQVRAWAWVYNSTYLAPDGGNGWVRFPALDVQGPADAGAGGVYGVYLSAAPVVDSALINQRLYYTTENITAANLDGGADITPVHRVTINTLY